MMLHKTFQIMRIAFFSVSILIVSDAVSAQETDPMPPDIPYQVDFELFTKHLQTGLQPYRVVYVASPEDEADLRDNYLGAAYLTENFGIIHAESLDDAQAENELDPIHAIIITPRALKDSSEKSIDWVQNGYRHGLVVAFVNVTFKKHLKTLGIEECPGERAIPLVDYPMDWVAAYSFYLMGEPEQVEAAIAAYDDCTGTLSRRTAYGSVGSTNTEMNDFRGGLIALAIISVELDTLYGMIEHFQTP